MSAEEIGAQVEPGFWKLVDGVKSGRFCSAAEIVGAIDTDRSGTLAPKEFVTFFQDNPAREKFHDLAVHHLSGWGDRNDFELALNRSKDFAGRNKVQKHQLFVDQIEPTLWGGDNLADLGLPGDKVIWSYHPITFVAWIRDKMKGQAQEAKGIGTSASFAGKTPPKDILDDALATDAAEVIVNQR